MFEFLLNYPRMVYDQGELIFVREWPLSVAFTVYAAGLLVLLAMLVRRRGGTAWPRVVAVGVLQAAMLALVLLVIWQPAILIERLRAGDNVIAVMLDTSSSMNYGEPEGSRMQQAQTVLAGDTVNRLGEEYSLQRYVFAERATAVDDYAALPPPSPATLVGGSLEQVLSMARVAPLGAVLLLSDGGDNAGGLTPDQLAAIAAYDVPVHTIGIGSERIVEDLQLQDVTLPGQALPGTLLAARVAIRHDQPGLARLKVYDEDQLVMSEDIRLGTDTDVTTAWVDIPVPDAGYRALRFTLDPWEGEQILENNTLTRVVDVREDRYRILYVEGEPRWEYKFMRRAIEQDPGVQLVTLLRVSQNKFYRQGIDDPAELEQGFPTERAELFRYNALIIGSIEAASFTPEQQQMIHDFVSERGGSLMLLAGPAGLGAGGWGNSQVGEVLPARISEDDGGFVRRKARAMPTAQGEYLSMLRFDENPAENRKRWQELPEIADYQHIGALKPAAMTLLSVQTQEAELPLLVTQPYGRGHSYIMATGGTWRWQMSLPVADQRHETFWRQFLRELVINSPGRFKLTTRTLADEVTLLADIRDDNYEPERALQLTAVVTPESGDSMMIDLHPSLELPGLMTATFPTTQSGLYTVETITRRDDEPVAAARMAFHHDAGQAEFYSMRRNTTLLQQIADATGGRYWEVEDLDELPAAISYSAAGITERDIRPVWNAPLLFLLLVLLKATEWLLRRRWNTI